MDPLRAAPGADVVLAAVAGEPGVHVVGGAVRDALRGAVPRELDLVVEGDAVAVARRAAERIGGAVTAHERFGTATVRADGFVFDLASARVETYPRPGALPEVRLGATIEQDLARRDFTVNALAVRLADGELTAWPGAREDLDAGVLRVLHANSFVDDPTRMLRLARYVARLGFTVDPETAALVDVGAFATVTGDRLGAELRLALREPRAALRELGARGMGAALLGDGFEAGWLAERAPTGLVALAACCVAIAPDSLASRLDFLGFKARERDLVVDVVRGFTRLRGRLDGDDAALWRALRRERPETVQLLAAAGEPGAARWLDVVRHRRLAITGEDLLAAGLRGPQVGEALGRATVAMLEGRAPDREAQLRAALPS